MSEQFHERTVTTVFKITRKVEAVTAQVPGSRLTARVKHRKAGRQQPEL